MFRRPLSSLLLVASLWTASTTALAQRPTTVEITYDRALALAREKAPALSAARARAREAQSAVKAASVWRFNPELQGAAGPRFRSDGAVLDWQLGAQQWLELGGQRGDRSAAARAGAAAGEARSEDAQRLLLRDVSLAFIAALYWERRVAIAEENLDIAEAVDRTSARRQEVGDAGGLDAAASALAVVRAQSQVDRARAALTSAEGRLQALLGMDPSIDLACRGDLRRLGIPSAADAEPGERPDLRALKADVQQADAQVDLGRAGRVPNLAVGARYNREELEHRVQGTLTIALPMFDRGQGTTAVARARRERLQAELQASQSTATVQAHTADAVAESLSDAARRFEEGLETLERAEQLATTSYAAGAIPLGELLAIRRELVDGKIDHADLLLEAATAHVELAASTGALR